MKVSYIVGEKEKRGIKLYSIVSSSTLKQVAEKLCEHNVGALLVVDKNDPERYIGIISERDLIRFCCEDKPLDSIRIEDIKLKDLIVITAEDSLELARSIMIRHHIRHLPVIENGKISGMITIRDVVDVLDEQKDIKINHLSDFVGGTYGNKVF